MSAIVVVVGVGDGDICSYGPAVPSTPVVGCGGAWPVAADDGVSDLLCAAFVMSGGAFW